MKRITGILTAVCTALFIAVQTAFSAPAEPERLRRINECFGYFMEQRGSESFWDGLESGTTDWAAYCYARLSGADGAEKYATSVEKHVAELAEGGAFVRPTEYQRSAICIAVTGGNASQAAQLGTFGCDYLDKQGFNAYIWALIAINVTGLEAPENAVNTAESLTEYIISQQHDDGSFSLFGDSGDVDITAAAVYALCGADVPGASQAAERGAEWLSGFETYSTMGVRNCESTAQAVMALSAAGYTEKAISAASQLEEYHREGGYAHLPDGEINSMATAQAMEALTALELAERGESLFGKFANSQTGDNTAEITENVTVTAEAPTEQPETPQTADTTDNPAENGGFNGTHIKIIISGLSGAGALACVILFVVKRRKMLIPAAVLLAALSGGVWLLDIRTADEYYAQSVTGGLHVTFSADCLAVLDDMDSIDEDVNPADVIPADGIVIAQCGLSLPEGASAFDALTAAARAQKVRVDYTGGMYGTYVRSIGYISEFGFGELSGWMYRVNGKFPDTSASNYVLSEGDVVEFVYTCDLGRDVGDVYSAETSG